MKVLLITSNLYKSIGGGQTVYKKIIESTPDVEFFYFVTDESPDAKRPPNAHPIHLQMRRRLRVLAPPPYASFMSHTLEEADQYARSVAGKSFDIVDMPDFFTFGSALRYAFSHHEVNVGRVILALHGNISDSMAMNWGSPGNNVLEERMMEQAQFKVADGAYGISPRYIKRWQTYYFRNITYIDPANFISTSIKNDSYNLGTDKPSLYCIGRTERRKGNDLFVELIRWLKRSSFKDAAHVGDDDYSYQGISSSFLLESIAKHRGVNIKYKPAMDLMQMEALYAKRSIVVLPVRYDTLNLVALEALFSGCPIAVSEMAGVCDYLDQFYPGLPYIKINFDNFYDAAGKLQDLIDNYDRHRNALLKHLNGLPPKPLVSLDMKSIYQEFLDATPNDKERLAIVNISYEEYGLSYKQSALRIAKIIFPGRAYRLLRRFISSPKNYFLEKIRKTNYFGDAKYLEVLGDARKLPLRLKRIANYRERNVQSLREKLDLIYSSASSPLYRCNFWQEIARIERNLGNELIAVTYELRILRLIGNDPLGMLPGILETLKNHGFYNEANAAAAMFGISTDGEDHAYEYLKSAYKKNLVRHDKAWQIFKDSRNRETPKVSIIVSLYNAADKLNFFLTALIQQSLIKQGQVEVILVDSGSPTDEYKVVSEFLKHSPLNLVYARSAERETIQAAWNRGIGLAKSPYLVFLGVDETLYPEALEVLAGELDKNPEIDWVMANSLVTAVEENGIYKHDIMSYIRDGASKDHTYLETCYLSWVGGMYRSSVHTRFGYYDESFSAAGDTEFKNRILPYINVKFINRILGLFLNYPDGQTTASPKAEIEDLRAWYLHRTPGGVRYAFENRSVEDIESLICTSLGYRKSYCGHMSCDIEYASYLVQYLIARAPSSNFAATLLPCLLEMLAQLRNLEFTKRNPSRFSSMLSLVHAWQTMTNNQKNHRKLLNLRSWPSYGVLNDNRYEQHSWLWKSK